MSHEELDAYLDETLESAERDRFEAHLRGCASCQRAVSSWQRTGDALEAWATPFAGPPTENQLRTLRLKNAKRDEAPSFGRLAWAVPAVFAVVIAVVVFALRSKPAVDAPGDEWAVQVRANGSSQLLASNVTELGAPDVARHVTIGPDGLDVFQAARLTVLEKTKRRTRLELKQGTVVAHIEPGHAQRQFVVDSAPFRVTVVGTVFKLERSSTSLAVGTSAGVVRVERLDALGAAVETKLVPAGEALEWRDLPAAPADSTPGALDPDAGTTAHAAQAAVRGPSSPSTQTLAAWRQRAARGECEAVFDETGQVLKASPNHVGTLRVHGDCARKLNINAAAVDSYKKVLALSGSNGREAAEAMLLAASLLETELKDPAAVLRTTSAVSTLRGAPDAVVAAIHLRRAKAFLALGRVGEGNAEIELVLKKFGATPAAADAVRLKSGR